MRTFLSALGLAAVCAQPLEDQFTSLWPDNFTMPSKSYSGYLNVTDTKALHYIWVDSMHEPMSDPVVVWFNGGPGCSSLLGFMQENGPWVIEDFETLPHENPYPWNANVSMVYIEAPAGVGFSTDRAENTTLTYNDMQTAVDNMAAIEKLFEKFSSYLANPLFLSGESYAGIYVPYLAWQIY